jgi:hypothetical protein
VQIPYKKKKILVIVTEVPQFSSNLVRELIKQPGRLSYREWEIKPPSKDKICAILSF